jgi:hypothetical protein
MTVIRRTSLTGRSEVGYQTRENAAPPGQYWVAGLGITWYTMSRPRLPIIDAWAAKGSDREATERAGSPYVRAPLLDAHSTLISPQYPPAQPVPSLLPRILRMVTTSQQPDLARRMASGRLRVRQGRHFTHQHPYPLELQASSARTLPSSSSSGTPLQGYTHRACCRHCCHNGGTLCKPAIRIKRRSIDACSFVRHVGPRTALPRT